MKKIIPIILSSDNNYAKYLDVTLVSILVNAKKDTFYDVYLLIAPDFSQVRQKFVHFRALCTHRSNYGGHSYLNYNI